MRLNGFMALIAVVCIVGVMGGEILGPIARLRTSRIEAAGANEGGRAFRTGLAVDLFPNQSAPPPAAALPVLEPPRPAPHRLPDPVRSAVVVLSAPSGDQIEWRDPGAALAPLGGLPQDAEFAQADFTPSFEQAPFSSSFYGLSAGGGSAGAPGPSPAPEPPTWLMLLLGLGGIGLALRRETGRAVGLANAAASDNLEPG